MAQQSLIDEQSEPNDATPFLPERRTLSSLREAAAGCRGCHLWRGATQTVFGEGLKRARVMLVGETPGHEEDLAGKPFVGPAGRLLDEVLIAAGIDRADAYVTNVVKHFKWKPRGKRRLHDKPSAQEIWSCTPWLEAEIAAVRPEVIVCLGATAAKALIGASFRVSRQHGELVKSARARYMTATLHPSAVLRRPGAAAREEARQQMVTDLSAVAKLLEEPPGR
jgi:uracil-DNA glycosylase